ncbi:MAG TPA: hypothetical protein ENO23_03450 [Alphaproteobacteria bacterium]|nr:hypothetical protein [Alphaproteobacteria bacterium]
MRGFYFGVLASLAVGLVVQPALAKGDLATWAERLEKLVLGADVAGVDMSVKEYRIETGKAYRWTIESSGKHEYGIVAPEFFRTIWVRQVVVNDLEVKPAAIYEVEFDDEGEMEIDFVPIRPGTYEFRVKGFEERGMVGRFIVE